VTMLWRRLRLALTTAETLDRLVLRYDWPPTTWWPVTGDEEPPSVEDLAASIAAGRPAPWEARRRLLRRYRGALWELVTVREAELDELYRAVLEHDWPGEEEVDQVAKALAAPSCTEATRLMLLRGWGCRLRAAVERC
jgi:hypothetical protein